MKKLVLVASALLFVGGTASAADVANGEKKAKLCVACHSVTDVKNKVGPSLRGVVGRTIATAVDYKYSQPMIDYGAANGAWDAAKLDAYLLDPKKIVPGGRMAFGGIKKQEDRDDLIAYLATLTP
jgi:cytochrome c2